MSRMDRIATLLIPAFLALLTVLVPPLLGASTGWAQSKPAASTTDRTAQKPPALPEGVTPSVPATAAAAAAENYLNQGWSVVGPLKIRSADSKEIKLQAPKEDLKISLEGKTLTVTNPDAGITASAGSLQPDTWVYVCQLERNVVVVLSPQTAKMREQRNDK
ncbi:MAG: hypothetical protein LDL33_00095 [Desulfomonile sp.]|nr:hypothetical protein [Desulfomonile sp.]